jgi:mRNA interferase MazF
MDWIKEKLTLDARAAAAGKRIVKRGQVYQCNLGRGIGNEEEKYRPCVILQNNSQNLTSPNTIVAPITHTGATINVVVPITTQTDAGGSVILDGHALLGNIVTVSKARLGDYVTTLPKGDMDSIDTALLTSLNLLGKFETLQRIIRDRNEYIKKLQAQREDLQTKLAAISKN